MCLKVNLFVHQIIYQSTKNSSLPLSSLSGAGVPSSAFIPTNISVLAWKKQNILLTQNLGTVYDIYIKTNLTLMTSFYFEFYDFWAHMMTYM